MLGNTLALYSPALRVAEEFAMLDCLTNGRLAAGFPVGTSMDVNRCYGITPTETRPRFYEAHDLIMKAWTQPGPFPYNGRFNQLRYVNPWPQPLQKPHPPVWLAGGGSVETYEMAVNCDYTYSFLSFFGYQFAKKVMDTFWETADRLGADRNPYRAGFAQQICVAESDAQAEDLYREHVMYFFKKCLHVPSYFMETPGYRTKRSAEFIMKTNSPAEMAAAAAARDDWSSLVDAGFVIAGSPETVTERLIEACRGLRVGNLVALLQIGSMPHDLTMRNITMYAEHVMPRLRTLWAGEGWEHRWWPSRRPPGRRRPRGWGLMATPASSVVELRDGRFKIRLLEAGTGPPVLFLHGGNGQFWDPLTDALADDHRVLAPEHPGAGESQGLEHVEDLWDLVLYYNELLDVLGVERATVVGPLLRRHGRGRARRHQPAPGRAPRAHRPARPVARRPPRARSLRGAGRVPTRTALRRPGRGGGGVAAGPRPDRSRAAVPGLPDDVEHPPVHLAAARTRAWPSGSTAWPRRRCWSGVTPMRSSTRPTPRTSPRSSATPASSSSRAPATCRSSNDRRRRSRPCAPSSRRQNAG